MHSQQNLKSLFMDWMWGEQRCSHTAQKLAQLGPDWPLEVNNVLPCPGLRKVDLEVSLRVYVCVWRGGGRGGVPWGEWGGETFFHLALAGRSPDSSSSGNPSGWAREQQRTHTSAPVPSME